MNNFENNAYFWQKVDTLYFSSKFVLDRPKGSIHPNYQNLIYPVDYGYLTDTLAPRETSAIDVFKGSQTSTSVQTLIVAADILLKDLEVKLLVGCSAEEEEEILLFLNQTDFQKTILVRRGNDIPSWGVSD